ncbi:globin-coupled sensor protein [Devosia chinhatensis]|uniref:globin-coupled sensor protein n=1 Tax=Devosia chinhatensis TaxID=429727 RepID=UPI000697513E|nr:globin-coupled sensor protein [Devosia chinhatensis]
MDTNSTQTMSSRLEFIGLDESQRSALAGVEDIIGAHLPGALGGFYKKLVTVPVLANFFSGSAQMDRAQSSQVNHWKAIATGKFDENYVQSSRRIGLRHAQIGLEPRWYIGGYGVIVEALIKGVVADYMALHAPKPKKGLFGGKTPKPHADDTIEHLSEILSAMMKSVLVDIDMAVSVYFEQTLAASQARDRETADKIAWAAELTGSVLQSLASGDLTEQIDAEFEGGFAKIKDDTNALVDRLRDIMRQLRDTSGLLRTATGEILAGANDLSDRTTRQAATIEETTASMERLARMVSDNAALAEQTSGKAKTAAATAEAGGEVMSRVTEAMVRITSSSNKISNIIGIIDDIAFQTNLLALNASVEAARAGEAGKGFAVVAIEVRRLAQSAATASGEVKALVETSVSEVMAGESLVNNASAKLAELLNVVRESTNAMSAISIASRDQANSIHEISDAMVQMDEMTQHNAALVEETNAAIEQTEAQARQLDEIVDQFRLEDVPDRSVVKARPKAVASSAGAPKLAKVVGGDWSEF